MQIIKWLICRRSTLRLYIYRPCYWENKLKMWTEKIEVYCRKKITLWESNLVIKYYLKKQNKTKNFRAKPLNSSRKNGKWMKFNSFYVYNMSISTAIHKPFNIFVLYFPIHFTFPWRTTFARNVTPLLYISAVHQPFNFFDLYFYWQSILPICRTLLLYREKLQMQLNNWIAEDLQGYLLKQICLQNQKVSKIYNN